MAHSSSTPAESAASAADPGDSYTPRLLWRLRLLSVGLDHSRYDEIAFVKTTGHLGEFVI